jgi:hypothetical protein
MPERSRNPKTGCDSGQSTRPERCRGPSECWEFTQVARRCVVRIAIVHQMRHAPDACATFERVPQSPISRAFLRREMSGVPSMIGQTDLRGFRALQDGRSRTPQAGP